MVYRRSAQIALQASMLLALEPEGRTCRVRELAERLSVPATYLTKVLQLLTRAGLLRALRGPNGGVRLARHPRQTTLWDVLTAVEPVGEFDRCLLGFGRCDNQHPCALHQSWSPVRDQLIEMLRGRTLWELASQARDNGALDNGHGRRSEL